MEKIFKGRTNPRGMLAIWIIFLLHKRSMNGYEIMKEIEGHTKYWKPATGAIYPTLNNLKEKGLIKMEKIGSRNQKVYSLTNSGKTLAKQIMDNNIKRFRDGKFRRVIDSFLWPDEPEEIREIFEILYINLFDYRNSLKSKYKNPSQMKSEKEQLKKIIREVKLNKN